MRRLSAAFATLLLLAATGALAQGGARRLVVAAAPGSPLDGTARLFAAQLSKELGKSVVVDNPGGANGWAAAEQVAKSSADGTVMLLAGAGVLAIDPGLHAGLAYDPRRDFTPVSRVASNPMVLVVNPASQAWSAAELVVMTRDAKLPVPIATSGTGSISHLTYLLFLDSAKTRFTRVPYSSAALAISDVANGQVTAYWGGLPELIGPMRRGLLNPIGVAAGRRHPLMPDVRTLAEQRLPGVAASDWTALLVPAATPPSAVGALNRAARAALQAKALRAGLRRAGVEPSPSTPGELANLMRSDAAAWAALIRAKNVKAE